MSLEETRRKIDEIDSDLTQLLVKRMNLSKELGQEKLLIEAPVLNVAREKETMKFVSEAVGPELERYARCVYNTIFDVSKSYQQALRRANGRLYNEIKKAKASTPELFPDSATVACQGVDGAYSEDAAQRIFGFPKISFFSTFDDVFRAVEDGVCRYGILPIENSSYGSVNRVYDLMREHNFHISRSTKVRIAHKLLVKPGTSMRDIREVTSHEQALGQCSSFLKSLSDVKVTPCANTAEAASKVAESGRSDIAAISSPECARLYNLEVLKDDIQISDNNYTRFICISKDMEIYPGSNKLSVMMSLPHRPQSLYHTIARFATLGVNMSKLESRPIPGSDFEFMFYFDMEASLANEDVLDLICEMDEAPETFVYLGNYFEV